MSLLNRVQQLFLISKMLLLLCCCHLPIKLSNKTKNKNITKQNQNIKYLPLESIYPVELYRDWLSVPDVQAIYSWFYFTPD